jgi:hypothetical protein
MITTEAPAERTPPKVVVAWRAARPLGTARNRSPLGVAYAAEALLDFVVNPPIKYNNPIAM